MTLAGEGRRRNSKSSNQPRLCASVSLCRPAAGERTWMLPLLACVADPRRGRACGFVVA